MTSQGTLSNASMQAMMAGLQAALVNSFMRLFTNDVNPTRTTHISEFAVATFAGYGAVAIAAWNLVGTDVDGIPYIAAPITTFTYTGVAPDQSALGFWVDHGVAPTIPDLAGRFAQPFPFTAENLTLNVAVKIREDGKVIVLTLEDLGIG